MYYNRFIATILLLLHNVYSIDAYKIMVLGDFREEFEESKYPNGTAYGGIARIKTLVARSDSCVLYLGNFVDPEKTSPPIKQRILNIIGLVKKLDPSALGLARGEFVNAPLVTDKFFKRFKQRIPPSNAHSGMTHTLKFPNYCPGLFGYVHMSLAKMDSSISFKDIMSHMNHMTENVSGVTVAMGCAGYKEAERMAMSVPTLHIVIGGCAEEGDDKMKASMIATMKNRMGKDIYFMYLNKGTKQVGVIQFDFEDGNVSKYSAKILDVDSTIQPDQKMEHFIREHFKNEATTTNPPSSVTKERAVMKTTTELESKASNKVCANDSIPLAKTMVFLNGQCYKSECNYGSLITDAFVQYKSNTYEGKNWTDTPIGIIAAGAILNSINATPHEGMLYRQDIADSLIDDELVTVNMTGMNIRRALDYGFHFVRNRGAEKFLQVSGLRIVYDPFSGHGQKLVSVKVRSRTQIPVYSLLIRTEIYRVILPQSLLDGQFGHINFKKAKIIKNETISIVDAIALYIEELKLVYASNSDRIMVSSRTSAAMISVKTSEASLSVIFIVIFRRIIRELICNFFKLKSITYFSYL